MSGYDAGLSVLDLPYLFENYDDIYTFLDSDVCQEMLDDFSSTGAKILNLQCVGSVSYTHLRAHETDSYLVCRLLLEKKKNTNLATLIGVHLQIIQNEKTIYSCMDR